MAIVGFVGILPFKMLVTQNINFGGCTVELVLFGFAIGISFCGLFLMVVSLFDS